MDLRQRIRTESFLNLLNSYQMRCEFPSENGWSKTVFDYSLFSMCLALPVAYFVLSDTHLERFYYPLAMAAKSAVLIQICESLVYILWLPENFDELTVIYNCSEVFFSRLHAIVTIFGEMHLAYFLARVLGLDGHSLSIGRGWSLTLPQVLVIALLASFCTFVGNMFYQQTFGIARNFWIMMIALLQYQQIRAAKSKLDSDACFIKPSDATVKMFEKLTVIQGFAALVCLLQRGVYRPLFPVHVIRLNNARLVVDYVSIYIFYFKVLLVKEKTNVEITMGEEGQ